MAQLGQAFDSSGHEDMLSGFEPIPAGDYKAKVVESDLKVTAAGTGKYIKLKFEIIEGEFKGRFVWTNINIINPNPVAVDIAQKELATLCRAVGKAVIQDTKELHGIPILIQIIDDCLYNLHLLVELGRIYLRTELSLVFLRCLVR